MKKIFSVIILIILATLNINLYGQHSYKCPDRFTLNKNKIKVGVIPQVELISVIQSISEYPKIFSFLMATDSSTYKTEVLRHFESFNFHPAVQMFNRLSKQAGMLNFNAPSYIMLYTDEQLKLREDVHLDDFVIKRAGGKDSLNIFLNHLRDFAEKSSFNSFYNTHENYYNEIIGNTVKELGETDYVNELENFYGVTQKSYNIVLVSLYNHVGFGNSLLCFDNQREIYNTLGPQKVLNKIPSFGDEKYLKYKIRHEFSHPFVNPLTEKNWDYIKEYSNNFKSVPEAARKNVCGDWQECINEFTIRSITTQLGYNESDEFGSQQYSIEKSRGVSYLDKLLEKIRYYYANRESFKTFESYFQNILDVYKSELN